MNDRPRSPSPGKKWVLAWALASGSCAFGANPDPSTERGLDVDVRNRWLETARSELCVERPLSEPSVRRLLGGVAEQVVARSPQVGQANADWQAAQSDVDQAKGARWPKIQIGAGSPTVGINSSSRSTPGAVSINASLPLLDWGYLDSVIQSRTHLEKAGELKWMASAEAVSYEASANLVEQSKNAVMARSSAESIARIQSLVKMLVEIVAVDPGRASELTQARARLLQAMATRDAIDARLRALQVALRRLLGPVPVSLPTECEWQLITGSLESALSTLDRNPSIGQAQAETASALSAADAARASKYPQLNVAVTKTTQRDIADRVQPWQAGLVINWTAFEGGAAIAAEKAARQRAVASEMRGAQLREDAESQVRAAYEDATTLAQRALAYRDLVVETEKVRRIFFEQWFHLGRRSLLDVLQAESDYSNNQIAMHTAQFDAYQAVLKMHAANGSLTEWLAGRVETRQAPVGEAAGPRP